MLLFRFHSPPLTVCRPRPADGEKSGPTALFSLPKKLLKQILFFSPTICVSPAYYRIPGIAGDPDPRNGSQFQEGPPKVPKYGRICGENRTTFLFPFLGFEAVCRRQSFFFPLAASTSRNLDWKSKLKPNPQVEEKLFLAGQPPRKKEMQAT